MQKDPEPPTPEEKSHPAPLTDTPVLPFDIDEYLPKHQRTRAWFSVGKPEPAAYSMRESLGATTWKVLTIVMLLFVALGVIRFSVWSFQSSYFGAERCYQIELWLHGVNSDLSRIQWALADAEQEVTSETEAEEANDRIWQMFADMRTSVAGNRAPEEVAELKALWLQFLDLGFEIREANTQGDDETSNRLRQEQDEVLALRLEEEREVLRNCRLAETGPDPSRSEVGGNSQGIRSGHQGRRNTTH